MTTRDDSDPAGRRLAETERARREREAKALRENLLRRKAQARARDAAPAPGGAAKSDGGSA